MILASPVFRSHRCPSVWGKNQKIEKKKTNKKNHLGRFDIFAQITMKVSGPGIAMPP